MKDMDYTLLCDFYELTMGNGYLLSGALGEMPKDWEKPSQERKDTF